MLFGHQQEAEAFGTFIIVVFLDSLLQRLQATLDIFTNLRLWGDLLLERPGCEYLANFAFDHVLDGLLRDFGLRFGGHKATWSWDFGRAVV
jgi:hypothetical protein